MNNVFQAHNTGKSRMRDVAELDHKEEVVAEKANTRRVNFRPRRFFTHNAFEGKFGATAKSMGYESTDEELSDGEMHRGVVVKDGDEDVYNFENFRDDKVKRRRIIAHQDNTEDTEAFDKKHKAVLADFKTRLGKKEKLICPTDLSKQLLALTQRSRADSADGGDKDEHNSDDSSGDVPALTTKPRSMFSKLSAQAKAGSRSAPSQKASGKASDKSQGVKDVTHLLGGSKTAASVGVLPSQPSAAAPPQVAPGHDEAEFDESPSKRGRGRPKAGDLSTISDMTGYIQKEVNTLRAKLAPIVKTIEQKVVFTDNTDLSSAGGLQAFQTHNKGLLKVWRPISPDLKAVSDIAQKHTTRQDWKSALSDDLVLIAKVEKRVNIGVQIATSMSTTLRDDLAHDDKLNASMEEWMGELGLTLSMPYLLRYLNNACNYCVQCPCVMYACMLL